MAPDPAKPATQLRRDVDREVVQAWLDALSKGACDEQAFLRAVEKLARRSIEAGWDSLALLDQYYRLGKIPTEVFNSVKSRLGSHLVGAGNDGELSVPLPQADEERPPPAPTAANDTAPRSVAPTKLPTKPAAKSATPPTHSASSQTAPTAQAPQPGLRAAPPAADASMPMPPPAATPPPATPPAAKQPASKPVAHLPLSGMTAAASAADPAARRESPASSSTPSSQPDAAAQAQSHTPSPAAPPTGTVIPQNITTPRTVEPLRRPRREIAVGEVLRGRYVIKSILGRGGTGTVFEAVDLYRIDMPDAGQRVALKVLHGQISGRPELLTELQREFQLLQSLSHPNIVRAHDFDRDGEIAFFTMEQLRGLSLTGVLAARNQMPLERPHALSIVRDVGAAVAHAHSRAVVHGDLNPGNIFITNEGEVRVLDFGAARASIDGPTLSGYQSDPAPIATPRYASPQVLEGKRPDARDDMYSLACIAYLLLTGKHPFGEKTALEAHEQRLRPSRPSEISGRAWRALRQGLAFDRERRPSDVTGWLEAFDWSEAATRLPLLLALVRVSSRKRGRFLGPVLGTAAVVAALAAAWWAISNFDLSNFNLGKVTQPSEPEPASVPAPAQPEDSNPADRSSAAARSNPAAHSPAAQSAPGDRSGASAGTAPNVPARTADQPSAGPPSAATPAPATPSSSQPKDGAPAAVAGIPPAAARNTPSAPASASASSQVAADGAQGGVQPRSRVELAADTIEVPLTDPAARVIVRRRGSLHGDATFTWWTESGTAKPGQDFMAVAPHQEVIEDGKNAVSLFIPVVGDGTRQQPKSFYVVINDPGAGVSLGARTLTMVTIPPSQ